MPIQTNDVSLRKAFDSATDSLKVTTSGVSDEVEQLQADIGLTSANVTFSQDVLRVSMINTSPTSSVFVEWAGGTATTASSFKVGPGEFYSEDVKVEQANGISLIADGTTSDVRFVGFY